jgi:predicted small secreted protein
MQERIMIKQILTVLMVLSAFGTVGTITGCNTVAGAGKDIERGGEKVQQESKEVQKKM